MPTASPAPTSTPAPTPVTLGLVAGVNAMTGWCLDKVIFHLEDGTDFESGINGGSLRTRQDIDTATEHLCGLKHYGVSYDYNGYSGCDYMGLGIELTVCSIATGFITHLISYIGDPPDGFGSKAVLYDSGFVSWPCQIVGFETQPDDTDIGTRETITNVTTNCEGSQFAPKTPPPPTQGPSPTPRPVALDSAPQQESLPTSRPTEPSATPDEPLGLPEESPTAAPTAESDGALGRRLLWAAACVLAALLL